MKNQDCFFCVTIDTECDRSPNWSTSDPLTFRGILEAIPNKLSPIFQKYRIRPTYFLSHEVIENPECCIVLKEIKNCELGTHLHGDFVQPKIRSEKFAGTLCNEMQHEYTYDIEYKKLSNLTKMFSNNIGYQPLSFRAGRFGISYNTGKILMDLGYKVDSSVTPHLLWKDRYLNDFPDFRDLPEQPYFISKNGNIWETGSSDFLEIPLTIRKKKFDLFSKLFGKIQNPLWLRPWYSSSESMIQIVENAYKEAINHKKPYILVMMFHNMELIPGASPYPQSIIEVEQYLDSLEKLFNFIDILNIKSKTLSEIYELFL